jgi:hypothetical protein
MPAVGSTIRDTRSDAEFHDIDLVEVYKSIDGGVPEFIENYEVPRSEAVVDGEDVLVYAFDYSYVLTEADIGTLVLSYVALPPNAGVPIADSNPYTVVEYTLSSAHQSTSLMVGLAM